MIHWTSPGYSTDRVRAWRSKNKVRQQKTSRRYYLKNRKRLAMAAKKRYMKNPKAVIARVGKHRAKNYDAYRDTWYKKRYGITLDQYNKMLAQQEGKCALCGQPPKKMRLAVEHCHRDKRVRGLACFRCNKFLIGRWKSEHAELFRKAARYLESSFDGRMI